MGRMVSRRNSKPRFNWSERSWGDFREAEAHFRHIENSKHLQSDLLRLRVQYYELLRKRTQRYPPLIRSRSDLDFTATTINDNRFNCKPLLRSNPPIERVKSLSDVDKCECDILDCLSLLLRKVWCSFCHHEKYPSTAVPIGVPPLEQFLTTVRLRDGSMPTLHAMGKTKLYLQRVDVVRTRGWAAKWVVGAEWVPDGASKSRVQSRLTACQSNLDKAVFRA